MKVDWNQRFIDLSSHVANWSKDRSTGVGAIITKDNIILSVGYNGFPRGANDDVESRHQRPAKYKYTEHAERNAIYNAARKGISLDHSKLYIDWFPCVDCCRAIIQSGIEEIVCKQPDLNDERWGSDFIISLELFKECKVKITYHT